MRLSDLRPCDNCGGKLEPHFYVVRYSLAFIGNEANMTLAMAQHFNSLEIAEVMSPGNEIKIAGEENAELWEELFICQNCYLHGETDLASISERKNNKEPQAVEED